MKNLILCGVLFCAMSVAGCGKCGGVKEEQTQQRAERFPPSAELFVDVPVTTTNIELVGVSYTKGNNRKTFQALIGPDNAAVPASYSFHHSDSSINLQDGWAFMSGDQPMGEAREVCASTSTTTIILQVVNGSDPNNRICRVVLLQRPDKLADHAYVHDKSIANPKIITMTTGTFAADQFVQKIGSGELSNVQDVSSNSDVLNFVNMVKAEAVKAGILESGTLIGH